MKQLTFLRPGTELPTPPSRDEPWLSFVGDPTDPACQTRIAADGRVFIADEYGELHESYDWARFGRIVYRALTRKEPRG